MALDLVASLGWTWMGIILWGIGSIICLVVFCYQTYVTINQDLHRHSKKTFSWTHVTHFTTIACLFFYVVHSWTVSLFKDGWMVMSCDNFLKFALSSYHIAKGFMYFVLVLRLKIVFGDSQLFAYPQSLIITLLIFVAVQTTAIVTLDVIYVFGDSRWFGRYFNCNANAPKLLLGCTVGSDLFCSVFTLYLFVRKLRQVMMVGKGGNVDTNSKLQKLLTKYTVLSMVAMMSTIFFMLIIGVLGSSSLTIIDVVINAISMCLLSARYDYYYKRLCCGALWCVSICSGQRRGRMMEMMQTDDNIEATVGKDTNTKDLTMSPASEPTSASNNDIILDSLQKT